MCCLFSWKVKKKKNLLSGKGVNHTANVQRIVSSLGQDNYRVVRKGQWKLPTHILIFTTIDLGASMKTYPISWNRSYQYIIVTGTFNFVCTYLKLIGKKMDGSGPTGPTDMLLECGLISSGSLKWSTLLKEHIATPDVETHFPFVSKVLEKVATTKGHPHIIQWSKL